MPKTKNQAKNKDRFEVRGGVLPNQYEFQVMEGAMEEERHRSEQGDGGERVPEAGGTPPEERAALVEHLMAAARKKAARKKAQQPKSPGKGSRARVGTKKGAKAAARKGAKKAGPAKKGAQGSARKSVAKKSAKRGRAGAGRKAR